MVAEKGAARSGNFSGAQAPLPRRSNFGTTAEDAEKGALLVSVRRALHLQGLKPLQFGGFIGPTKVVPLLQSARSSFSPTL